MLDGEKFGRTVVDTVKGYLRNVVDPLAARVKALEARQPEAGATGEPGADGKDGIGLADILREADGTLVAVMSDGRTKAIGNIAVKDGIDGINGKDGEDGKDGADGKPGKDGIDGKDGRDGKDADMDAVKEIIDEAVAKAVADAVAEAVAQIPMPKNGRDADPVTADQIIDAVKSAPDAIQAAVAAYLTSNPPAPGQDGRDGVDGKDGAAGVDGKDGRDGLDVKEMFRAEGGHLLAVMSDGTTRDLGVFVGKDGEPGKPGRDGFSLEDFDATLQEDGRTLTLSFARGDQSFHVELGIPAMIYRGVWQEAEYQKGDTVTYGGSLWHCDADGVTAKPGEAKGAWTLAAKRGRDGKNAEHVEKSEGDKAKEPIRFK